MPAGYEGLDVSGELLAPRKALRVEGGQRRRGPGAQGPQALQDSGCSWSTEPAEGFKAVDGVVSAACAGGPWAKAWPWAGGVVVTSAWRPEGHFPERWRRGLQCGDTGPAWDARMQEDLVHSSCS